MMRSDHFTDGLLVPLDGSPVSVAVERVAPGHYSTVEIELVAPPPALLAATPGWWAGATIQVRGRYTSNGTPLDPSDATARAEIAANARATVTVASETEKDAGEN